MSILKARIVQLVRTLISCINNENSSFSPGYINDEVKILTCCNYDNVKIFFKYNIKAIKFIIKLFFLLPLDINYGDTIHIYYN